MQPTDISESNSMQSRIDHARKICTVIIFSVGLISCTSIQNFPDLEAGLNRWIGQPFSAVSSGREDLWHKIDSNSTHDVFEFRRPDGCSYALSVNRHSNIVENWKFTSSRSLCEQSVAAPGA